MPLMRNGQQVEIPIVGIDEASAPILRVNSNLDKLTKTAEGTATSSDTMSSSFATSGAMVGKLSAYVAGATIAFTALKKGFELSEQAAQVERLTAAGEEMATQYGGNMDLILQKVQEASNGTVSEMDIIASANKAMMLGLGADADQLANLMEVAAFRGRAMGVSTTQAFDDIVRGVGRASPMILDNLGIIIDADQTYSDYAESIGKSKDELTKSEKTQALLNATLATGNEMLDKAGGLADDSASSFERWDASLSNFKTTLFGATSGLSDFADSGAAILDAWTESIRKTNAETDKADKIYNYATAIRRLNEDMSYDEAAKLAEEMINAQEATDAMSEAAMNQTTALNEDSTAIVLTTEQLKEMSRVNGDLLSLTKDIQRENERYTSSLSDQTEKQSELAVALEEAKNQYGETSPKVAELQEKYDEAGISIEELKVKHQDAMNSIAYDLYVAKLKAGEFTDEEYKMAIDTGVAMGQLDQETANLALSLNDLATAQANVPDGASVYANQASAMMGVSSAAKINAADINTATQSVDDLGAAAMGSNTDVNTLQTKIKETAEVGKLAVKDLQMYFDRFSTSKAIGQVNLFIDSLNEIPTDINVNVNQTTTSASPSISPTPPSSSANSSNGSGMSSGVRYPVQGAAGLQSGAGTLINYGTVIYQVGDAMQTVDSQFG